MKSITNKTSPLLALSAIATCLATQSAGAATLIDYHPSFGAPTLGKGFILSTLDDSPSICLEGPKSDLAPGAQGSGFRISVTKNPEQLLAELGIDVRAEAKVPLPGGGASPVRSIIKRELRSQQYALVLNGFTDFGSLQFYEPRLKPEYQRLIDRGKLERFAQLCGTHFIDKVNQGVRLSVVIHLNDLNGSERAALDQAAGVEGALGVVGGSANETFNSMLERRRKRIRTLVSAYSLGPDGISDITPLLLTAGSVDSVTLESLVKAMSKLLVSYTREKAAVTSFQVSSMERFGLRTEFRDEMLGSKYSSLLQLSDAIRSLNAGILRIEDAMIKLDTGRPSPLSVFRKRLPLALIDAKHHLDDLSLAHLRCLHDSSEELNFCQSISLADPRLLEEFRAIEWALRDAERAENSPN